MLAQLPTEPSTTSNAPWVAVITAIAGAIAVVVKKRFTRRSVPQSKIENQKSKIPDHVTRTEFHHGLDTMRDRVTAGYLAVAEKMDTHHHDVLAAVASQGTVIEQRLDALESAVARLDERTKKP